MRKNPIIFWKRSVFSHVVLRFLNNSIINMQKKIVSGELHLISSGAKR
jgi:hypothetical protein